MTGWLLMAFLAFMSGTENPCVVPSTPAWETVMQQGEITLYAAPATGTRRPLNAIYEYEGRYYAFAGRHDNDHGQCLYEIPEFTIIIEINGIEYEASYP